MRAVAVGENFFDDEFCFPVGIDRFAWVVFIDRQVGWKSEDSGGGGEDEVVDVMLLHCMEQIESIADVIGVISEWVLDRFAYIDESGKVEDGVDVVIGEEIIDGVGVGQVALDEGAVFDIFF